MTGLATLPRDVPHTIASSSRPLRRIVLLDPGLFFEGGHHASFARVLVDAARRRGVATTVVGAKRIDHPPAGLDIVRHFRTSPYAPLPAWGPLPALRACNDDVCDDACAIPDEILAAAGLLVVPTVTSRNALGLARWLQRRPASASPVALVFMFPPGWGGDETLHAAELAIYREAMAALAALPAGRVALFAETPPLAAMFMQLGAPDVHPLPWPVALARPATPRLPFDALGTPAHVAHLGYSKLETGFGLLPGVIRAVTRTAPEVRFTVQANFWNAPTLARHARDVASLAPAARVIDGALTPEAYADAMGDADIVLLPYDPAAYRDRGSGVFVEAAACGRIVVIPAGTWMADRAEAWNLAAVTFDAFDAAGVTHAVARAVDDRVALLARAAAAAPAWRDEHAPDRFLTRVLDALPSPAAASSPRVETPADDDFLDDGRWTPQTQMLRSIRDRVLACDDEPVRALSIDRNPTLDDILLRRWPALAIEHARYPEHDVQDLAAFADGTFDLVYSHQVLEHIPKPWRAATELVRVLRRGGLGVHTTCAYNPRHGYPAFGDYYRFLPDGLEQLFEGVDVLVKAGWGNRQALLHNLAIDDGHGVLGGRRFGPALGAPNDEDHPWHTWIIFRRC